MVTPSVKAVLAAGIALSLLSVMVSVGFNQNTTAYGAMYGGGNVMSDKPSGMMSANMTGKNHATAVGSIANIELDSNGQTAWIQSGIWVIRASFNESSGTPDSVWLIAKFAMVKPDGTARHSHMIYGFKMSEFSMEQNNTVHVVKGTATVTMKDGPVPDVPITIKVINGSVIGFWIGPDKVDNHFGSSPVYGVLSERSMAMIMAMSSMSGGGQMMGNRTGG
jgi:hypothetical protein